MIQLTLVNDHTEMSIAVCGMSINSSADTLRIMFGTDAAARDNETLLKTKGFKTEHFDNYIIVRNLSEFIIIVS